MALINSASKSSRLLASRRYTHDTFTDAQESFTNVLDLRAEEIYTQAQYIPSSALPFSGSSQHGSIQQASGSNLMKYWYRHKLTPSNVNTETWFFLNPTGSDDGVGAQLINDNQEVNFISPKYSVSSLANAITEDATPGYGVVLYKSSTYTQTSQTGSLGGGDKISGNDYIFDYKTGVVQFLNSSVDPATNEVVFMSAYQYVGKTLATGLDIAGDISASNMLLTGNLQLGGGSGDTISVTAEYSGSLIPDVDDAFDLGKSDQQWKDLYINGVGYIDSFDAVTSTGVVSGSAVYGTTLGQNTTSGLKTITIEDTSYINQDLTTDANVTFNHITASGNISSSGTIYADNFQSTGGSVEGISFTDDIKITGNMTASGDISGSATSTGSFGHIITSGEISASGRVYVNSEFPQLKISDDGYDDSWNIGISGNTGYLKSSDTNNGFRIRRSDNFDIARFVMSTETTEISGSGGLNVKGNVTSSGTITGSAVYGTTIGQNRTDGVKTITIEANSIINQDLSTDADATLGTLGVGNVTSTGTVSGSAIYGTTIGQNRTDGLKTITIEANSIINQDVSTDANATLGTLGVGNVTSTGTVSGSAVYGTTIGQNTTSGLKTITIESNSTVNQDLTTDASPTFDGLTLTGNTLIGTLAANRNLIVHGDLTAQNYIVSSSVTHLTQSFSSGSTIFGDSPDDTHRITGSLFIGTGSLQSVEHITGSGVISGSEVYGTTIGQNRVDGLKTITIESNSTINQDVTTDATPTFDGITSTGTIASSGLISGSGDLWVGDQSNYISGSTGNVKVSGKISASSAGFTDVSASTAEFTSATITGGTISGITDLAVADGGTGASTLNDLITLTTHTTGNYVKKVTVGTGLGGAVDSEGATAALTLDAAQTVITSLLATDIKIGEDNETRIDFGTPNEIHFYAGNQRQFELSDGSFAPTTDSDVDLGSTGVRWKDTYVDSITVTGDITGSAVYGTTLGQNRVDGLKTITIESNSTINQDVTTDATPTFGGATLTGDIKTSGVISGSSDIIVGNIGGSHISGSTGNLKVTDSLLASKVSGSEFTGSSAIFDAATITTATIVGGTVTGITDITVADGGTGASTFTDGGVLLGSGTDPITAMAVLGDGEFIVGDGSTDPVAESGTTLRTSIGVGTGDSPTFTGLTLTGDLTVQGDTTTLSTTNLQVGDAFIFTATGSAASNVDGGLIVQSGSAVDSGSAIYHDTQDERWAVAKGVASDGTAVTPTSYVTTATTANHNPNTDSGSYGSGEMWINTTDEEIWVRTG